MAYAEATPEFDDRSFLDRLSPWQIRDLSAALADGALLLAGAAVHDETTQMMDIMGPPAVEQFMPETPAPALVADQLVVLP